MGKNSVRPFSPTKLVISPSESQVISAMEAMTSGFLLESLDRHDGKQLIDGPGVGQRLKQREIGKISLAQAQVELLQLVGNRFEAFHNAGNLDKNLAAQPFRQGPVLQIEVSKVKQADRFLNQLDGVVVVDAERMAIEALVDIDQFFLPSAKGFRCFPEPGRSRAGRSGYWC